MTSSENRSKQFPTHSKVRSVIGRIWRVGLRLVLKPCAVLILLLLFVWGVLVLHYSNLPEMWMRTMAAVAFALASGLLLLLQKRRWRAIFSFLGLLSVVGVWWVFIPARNDRDWIPEMAVLPTAAFDGNRITVHNVRDFQYVSETKFTARYEDRSYDLEQLETVDFILSSWGMKRIAHTFLSFGFADGQHLAISIESRRVRGESYHPLAGLFKQYELMYVIGDERDLIGVRAKYRGEQMFLYPSTLTPDQARRLLIDMLQEANRLAETPVFYRTIGRNCTTSLIRHFNAVFDHPIPFHRYHLMNGYSDRLAYDRGRIATDLPFEELRSAHAISGIVQNCVESDPQYSQSIRASLPSKP